MESKSIVLFLLQFFHSTFQWIDLLIYNIKFTSWKIFFSWLSRTLTFMDFVDWIVTLRVFICHRSINVILIFMNFFAVHRFLLFLYLHYAFRCHLASILKHNFFFWKFWICLVYLIVLQSWLFLIKVKGLINIFSHIEIHKSFLSLLDALLNKFLNEVNLYFYFFLKINY
jgi:hypothetical protein